APPGDPADRSRRSRPSRRWRVGVRSSEWTSCHDRVMAFRIAGVYLGACNCDAICPCRRVNGFSIERSTHGVCYGVLTWRVDKGHAQGVDLAGSGALMTYWYDDDVRGSPWTLVLYVDGP